MIKHCILLTPLLSAVLLPMPVQARDYGTISGWFVTSTGETCGMFSGPRGGSGTETVILKRIDGALFVQVKNPSWRSGGQISYQVDGKAYDGPYSVNPVSGGYIATFGEGFEQALQAGVMLTVKRDDIVLDQIPLSGSAAALASVQSCVGELKSGNAIPGLVQQAGIQQNAKAKGGLAQWMANAEYPSSALRENREGIVAFRLIVDRAGKPSQCLITKSSGQDDLDKATCETMMSRAKFTPAVNASGAPVEGFYESRVKWKLPE
jgi:TonB family protein